MRALVLLAALAFAACTSTTIVQDKSEPPCDCPGDIQADGKICGGKSAFCRDGGPPPPACGTTTEKERLALYNQCSQARDNLRTK